MRRSSCSCVLYLQKYIWSLVFNCFSWSDHLLWCGVRGHRHSQGYNRICCPCCNRKPSSWGLPSRLYQVNLHSVLLSIYSSNIYPSLLDVMINGCCLFVKRLKMVDVPMSVSKTAPDFCTVYVISKTKISSVKNASRVAPFDSPLMTQIQQAFPKATPSMRCSSLMCLFLCISTVIVRYHEFFVEQVEEKEHHQRQQWMTLIYSS